MAVKIAMTVRAALEISSIDSIVTFPERRLEPPYAKRCKYS
jgi:hypothetical protein